MERDNKGKFKKGHKGYKGMSGRIQSKGAREKLSIWRTGRTFKPLSTETKKNISMALTGKEVPRERALRQGKSLKKKWEDSNFREHMILVHTGKKATEETKNKIRTANLNQSPELIKKRLKRNPMSSLEKKFQEIINKNNLPYRFVGNGEFLIGRKCPDFVNCNGKKIAIEVFYRKHKQMFRGSIEQWQKERTKIFNQYGWTIKFFDETMVKEDIILKELNGDEPWKKTN